MYVYIFFDAISLYLSIYFYIFDLIILILSYFHYIISDYIFHSFSKVAFSSSLCINVLFISIFSLGLKPVLLWQCQPGRVTLYVKDDTEY